MATAAASEPSRARRSRVGHTRRRIAHHQEVVREIRDLVPLGFEIAVEFDVRANVPLVELMPLETTSTHECQERTESGRASIALPSGVSLFRKGRRGGFSSLPRLNVDLRDVSCIGQSLSRAWRPRSLVSIVPYRGNALPHCEPVTVPCSNEAPVRPREPVASDAAVCYGVEVHFGRDEALSNQLRLLARLGSLKTCRQTIRALTRPSVSSADFSDAPRTKEREFSCRQWQQVADVLGEWRVRASLEGMRGSLRRAPVELAWFLTLEIVHGSSGSSCASLKRRR